MFNALRRHLSAFRDTLRDFGWWPERDGEYVLHRRDVAKQIDRLTDEVFDDVLKAHGLSKALKRRVEQRRSAIRAARLARWRDYWRPILMKEATEPPPPAKPATPDRIVVL